MWTMIVRIGGRLKLVAVEEDDRPPLPPHASPITVYDYKVSEMMKWPFLRNSSHFRDKPNFALWDFFFNFS
jgi:hypothetical protein